MQPLVEGVDGGVDELGVVTHPLLEEARQRREHEGPVEAELVHQFEPGPRLLEGRDGAHGLAHDLAIGLPFGVSVAEVLLLGPGPGDHVERGVGDVVADGAADHDLGPPVDLDVLNGALVLLGQVPGEAVLASRTGGCRRRRQGSRRYGPWVLHLTKLTVTSMLELIDPQATVPATSASTVLAQGATWRRAAERGCRAGTHIHRRAGRGGGYRVEGKPRSIALSVGSGQREVTTFGRV